MRRDAQSIVEIGQDLIAVKERLGHGQFDDRSTDRRVRQLAARTSAD